ncbi:phage terminase large subunit family protein [Roseomonas terrae]|uniref:Phage terminase large subunit family protein n=1 Tax=Neoroseomonas terrae TaxID=424799 RepID=A0ABS5EES5_9PROT|nr:terminase gpA endonuclease subunit [Neoroseomonas terrae]MBR0649524.1 phage terminase large subunit family protein [Neoroseomonas terrae]
MSGPLEPASFAFADPLALLRDAFEAILPPNRMSVADHAGRNRWVKSPVGAHLERWSHDTAPYLTEPMHWLSDDQYDTVGIIGPGACGKTMIAENWLLYTAESDPADLLWYLNTDAALDAYVKGRIEPMLDQHDPLLGHLRRGLGRDSVAFKRFRGGRAEFLTFTPSSLVNKHVARIVADEIDNYDESLGDPLALLNPRRQAAGADSKLLVISHPDRGAPIDAPRTKQRGIMAVYADSTRCTWWWRCPHCGTYSSPHPGTARRMVLDWPKDASLDEIQAKARLVCPTGCLIEDGERYAMNLTGRWVGEGETIDEDGRVTGERRRVKTAGAWILGVMSPFTKDGIGGLARAQAQAERAADLGDHEGLRQVMVKTFGEPYAPPARLGSIDAAVLAERADKGLDLGIVPDWVRFLSIWADAQGSRFEWLVRGWGEGGRSCVIDRQIMPAEPGTNPDDWDELLERLQETVYPLADGSGRGMRVRAAGFDAYGVPGVTEQAYAAWLRRRKAGKAQKLGLIEGRDVWNLVPTRGASARAAPRIMLAYPNSQRKDRKAAARGQVPLLLFNPNAAKDALAAQLAVEAPGIGSVGFPFALRDDAPPHEFFEQLAAETRDPVSGVWSKAEAGRRNEVLDMMVGCELVARLHGLHRIDWDRPPNWAASWETNSMLVAIESEQEPEPKGAAASAAPLVIPPVAAIVSVGAHSARRSLARMLP